MKRLYKIDGKWDYKLPYITDPDLYKAVMGAISYLKATGYFHKSVNYYARKYNVDPDEIAKYIRIAQGRGQKIANAKKRAEKQ